MKQYILYFTAIGEAVKAETEITADCDLDALDEATRIVKKRRSNGVRGTHTLILEEGPITIEQYLD